METEFRKIIKEEVTKALKRIKNGNAVGPNDIAIEVWKSLEEKTEVLPTFFNMILVIEKTLEGV